MGDTSMFNDSWRAVYIVVPPFVCASVLKAIFTNDIMKHYYFLAIHICVCFLLFTCLITLSQVCKLRRKPEAVSKPLSRLYDSDLESDDDTKVPQGKETNPLWSITESFFIFLRFRHIYAVLAIVGSLLLIPFLISLAAWYFFGAYSLEDLGTAFAILICGAIFLEYVVLLASNIPEIYTYEPPRKTYRPFDEFVRVPMKVFASKVLALYVKNFFSLASNLFYQLSAIYGLMVVYNMPEKEIRRFEKVSDMLQIYEILRYTMVIANICGFFILVEGFWTPCRLTKEKLLMTIEKNWERNLKAFDFLLSDKEVSTLEELRDALLEKTEQENLTVVEEKTLQYIARPMWKSKRVFLDKPKGVVKRQRINLLDPPKESPDNQSEKRSENKPSTSDNQPSTSGTTRQLRSHSKAR